MIEAKTFTTSSAILGSVIAKLRATKGIKQNEMAAFVGLNASTWSRIEKGESSLSIDQLKKAAKFLNKKPSEILGDAELIEKEVEAQGIKIASDYNVEKSAFSKAVVEACVMGAATGGVFFPIVGPSLKVLVNAIFDKKYAKDNKEERQAHNSEKLTHVTEL